MKNKIKKIVNNKILYCIFSTIYKFYYNFILLFLLGNLFKIIPINENKIVVCSYYGMDYGDNPKAIIDYILEKDKEKKYKIIWVLNSDFYKKNNLPDKIKKVKYETISCLYELVTAKIWIDNSRKKFVPSKRKKQFYIQTWHGGLCLKKVEKDAEDSLPKLYIKRAKKDSKNADLFISNSKWESKLYKKSFWYNGKILEYGLPRNDILINNENHKKIVKETFKKIGIDEKKKVLLYAPTFRKDFKLDHYNINFKRIIESLKKKDGCDWIILIKLHPNVANKSNLLKLPVNVINVSNYSDLYSLMLISDALITDYSSLMFDYGYLNRPILIYAPDIEKYNDDRGFMFNLYDLPFSISKNNNSLCNNILNFNNKEYLQKLSNFYKKVGLCETGKSSKKVAEIIMKVCDKNEN